MTDNPPVSDEQNPDAVLAACVTIDVPLAYYEWAATIDRDVRVNDLTPIEIAGLIEALRPDPAPKSAPPASGDMQPAVWMYENPQTGEREHWPERRFDGALHGWTETPLYTRPVTQPPADHSSEIERLRARVGALEEALKPFSMEYHADEPDHWPAFGKEAGKGWPTVGDFRLARALTADSEPADHSRGGVLADIQRERARQTREEGWALDHDDAHDGEELARAAACYATGVQLRHFEREYERGYYRPVPLRVWPWSDLAWNPGNDRRRQLVKAGALIVAEIERLDRLTPTAPIPESAGEPATRKANNERDRTNTAPVGRPGERSHPAVRSGNALRPEALETPPKPAPGDVAVRTYAEGLWARSRKLLGFRPDYMPDSRTDFIEEARKALAALTADSDAKPQGGEVAK